MMAAKVSHDIVMLSELLRDVASVSAADDREVKGLAVSDAGVQPGYVFFALAGGRQHGLEYLDAAVARGASAVVWELDDSNVHNLERLLVSRHQQYKGKVPVISVIGLQQKLGHIASKYYGEPSSQLSVIGITGTNGKTSCAHFLAQALNQDAPAAIIGTLGNGLVNHLSHATHTTPDAVTVHQLMGQYLDDGAKSLVMEVSSHGLEQGRVAGVNFDVAIFTNLSRDHLDYHGDMQSYAEAKRRLFQVPGLKSAVINADDAYGKKLISLLGKASEHGSIPNVVSYGLCHDDHQVSVRALNVQHTAAGLAFTVQSPWGTGEVQSSLLGQFNVSNLLAVLCSLLIMGMPFEKALARLNRFTTIEGRMERASHVEDEGLFVVDYAHTPDALQNALQSLRAHMKTVTAGKLWCVFGCGGDRDRGKRHEMGSIAQQFADQVVITDDNPRTEASEQIIADIVAGLSASEQAVLMPDRLAAIAHAVNAAGKNDIVLVAGKGHEEYQIIGTIKHPYAGDKAVIDNLLRHKRLGNETS